MKAILLENKKLIKGLALLLIFGIFFWGNICNIQVLSLGAVVAIFLYNIIENLCCNRRSLFYIMFHGFIFLFILDRPIINLLRGEHWWYFSDTTVKTVLFILMLSMLFLNLGFYSKKTFVKTEMKGFEKLNQCLERISGKKFRIFWLVVTIVMLGASLIKEIINMLHHGNYADIYMGVQVEVPFVVNILAGMSVYCMFLYLAMLPSKWKSIVVLGLYLLTGVPGIITGGRNALMIKALFCFMYFVLRELLEKTSKWIGKREIVAVLLMIPILMVGLGIMNYSREGADLPTVSPIEIGEDFLYKQGTSFDTLGQTVEYRNALRDSNYINYTFGELIDFVLYNKISNVVFGTLDFGDGNNVYSGTLSNKLAHRVSYLALGNSYLAGHGRGTTYFSEIYLDFGYLGIALFNWLIGLFLSKIGDIFKKGIGQRLILMNCLLYFFIIPRLSFFSIVSFSINYYFWIFSILVVCIYFLSQRRKQK